VDNKYTQNISYFDDIVEYMENPHNMRSIYEYLKTYDMSDKKILKKIKVTNTKAIGIYKSQNPVVRGVMMACRIDKNQIKNEVIDIKRKNLYELMVLNNLINPMEFKASKMADFIKDNISDKIIWSTAHSRITTYHIRPSEFKYDKKVWEMLDRVIEEKDSLKEEFKDDY